MKSISKFAVAAAVMLFASAASAGTLYWQVDNVDDFADSLGESSAGYGAELWMVNKNDNSDKTSLSDGLIDAPTGIQQADITNYTVDQYLFYVELVNYTTGASTEGYKWGYGDLVSSGYVAFGATDFPTVSATAAAHNFAAAPEPSSGLLLLMGGAMLALRRRRQK